MSKYVLVDGYSLVFRAYHAIPPDLVNSRGEQTNAVFGFCGMLLSVIAREAPDGVAVAFDVGKAFRHVEYAQYKAHRPPMPDDLQAQMGRVRQVIERFGFPIYEQPGYEADDVIGSLARRLEEAEHDAVLVTGDSDLLQLVTDRVHVARPERGKFTEPRVFDPATVEARYGFEPRYIADYKALVGDTSDNVPGVPGVGDKTAKALIAAHGDVESILAHLPEVKPERVRRAIEGNAEQLRQSKRLCTIVTEVDVDVARLLDADPHPDRVAVVELFQELEFRSLVPRVRALPLPDGAESDGETAPPERVEPVRHHTLRTPEEVRAVVARYRDAPLVAFDTETDRKSAVGARLVGVSFACEPGEAYYVPMGHEGVDADAPALLEALRPLLGADGPPVVAHNAKFDGMVLDQAGLEAGPLLSDTSLEAFLLNETSVGLKDLALTRLGLEMQPIEELIGRGKKQRSMAEVPVEEAAPYAAADADATLRLHHQFGPELEERGQTALLREMELPLVPALAAMEMAGVCVDTDALGRLSRRMYEQSREYEARIWELAGYELNLGSSQQLSKLLFRDLGLKSSRRTATGAESTDVHALEALAGEHPIIDLILAYRQVTKLKNTYVDALPLLVNRESGRVHTSFNQTVASTGRLSSTDPNLQNIPVRTEQGREVRKAFVASSTPDTAILDGPTTLLSCDYSQIELRVLAHLTGEELLVEAFARDEDPHRLTASQLYEVPLADVTPDQRRTGKTINFGILYGMTGFRLARDTGLSRAEATEFVRRYNERYPRIRALFDDILRRAERNGYVESASGRRRVLPDLRSTNAQRREAAQRAAINMPIQGMAADIIKRAMIGIHARQDAEGHRRARMLLQVHDELLFEVRQADLVDVAALVVREMSSAMELRAPLVVEAKAGASWGEMAPLELPVRAAAG